MKLAPIILFVYNRPSHTEQTLNALTENELADQSTIYIYADGAKDGASDEERQKVEETRRLIHTKKWCKEVHIVESNSNKGLADSIIQGITEVVNTHEKVIVLEDDLVANKWFLKYMNDALLLYENTDDVAGVSGWAFDIDIESESEVYFSKIFSCWGWGTWKRAWLLADFNGEHLLEQIVALKTLEYDFNVDNSYNYSGMLKAYVDGKNDSWAVRFYASMFLQNKLFFRPKRSFVKNIGFDNSGVNCSNSGGQIFNSAFDKNYKITLNGVINDVTESKLIRKAIISFFEKIKTQTSFYTIIRDFIKNISIRLIKILKFYLFQITIKGN